MRMLLALCLATTCFCVVSGARTEVVTDDSTLQSETHIKSESADDQGTFALNRKGIEVQFRLGTQICVDGEGYLGKCRHASDGYYFKYPGPGGGIFLGLRPKTFFSAGVDFGYYFFVIDSTDHSAFWTDDFERMMTVSVAVRGYLPFKYVDAYLAVGMGYFSLKEWEETGDLVDGEYSREYSPVNFKLGAGVTVYIPSSRTPGSFGMGLDCDYLFFHPIRYKDCWDGECSTGENPDRFEAVDVIQVNLHLSWIFPIFDK